MWRRVELWNECGSSGRCCSHTHTHTQISLNVYVLISVSDVRDVRAICPNSDNTTNSHCSPPAERWWWWCCWGGRLSVCVCVCVCVFVCFEMPKKKKREVQAAGFDRRVRVQNWRPISFSYALLQSAFFFPSASSTASGFTPSFVFFFLCMSITTIAMFQFVFSPNIKHEGLVWYLNN